MDWFLYDNGLRHEIVKDNHKVLQKGITTTKNTVRIGLESDMQEELLHTSSIKIRAAFAKP